MIPFTRLGLQQMQMLGAGAPTAGLPRFITDLFNLLQNSPTYTGGPLTATDYEGNLVTSPAGVPAFEGGVLFNNKWSDAIGPNYRTGAKTTVNLFDESGFWARSSGGTATPTTDVFTNGNGSILLDTGAPSAGVHIDKLNTFNFSLSANDFIVLRVFLPADIPSGFLRLTLVQDTGFTKYFSKTVSLLDSMPIREGWVNLVAPRSEFAAAGGADWSLPVTGIRVRLDSAPDNSKVYVDGLYVTTKAVPQIVFTFDDGNLTDYTEAFSYMQTKNMVGTSFIVSSLIGTEFRLDVSKMQEMYAAGWDFGNHTEAHADLTLQTSEERIAAIVNCTQWLTSNGFSRSANYLAYPFGFFAGTSEDVVAAGVIAARTVKTFLVETSTGMQNPLRFHSSVEMKASNNLAALIAKVDEAVSKGQSLTILAHSLVPSAPGEYQWAISDFRSLVDYVAAKRDAGEVEVKTFREFHEGYSVTTPIQPSISIPTRSGTKKWYQEPFANPFGYSNWPARTNLFLNSNTPVTQNITTTAQQYTISVLGTGDVTVSGTAIGTATEGAPLTVTATVGTLTCTVTGTLSRVQVEAGAFASPFNDTASTTVTRAATNLTAPMLALGTQLQLVVIPAATSTAGTLLDDGTNKLSYNGTTLVFTDGVTTLSGVATLTAGTAHTIGVKGLAGDWALSLDTADIDTDVTGSVIAWTPASVNLGRNAADGDHFAGYFPNAAGFSGSDPLWYKTNLGA
jgi:peptidoglycan/xylan/chitin deacetylase (PgdA/CDA1 family)